MSSPLKTFLRPAIPAFAALVAAILFISASPLHAAPSAADAPAVSLQVGAPFPALATHALEGTPPELAGRVVLVDFWATWCAPCKASFPFYGAFQAEFAARGFTVLGVSVDKTAGPYNTFLKRFAPGFPTVRDATQSLVASVRPPSMPTCYLLDRRGVVRLIHGGFHGEADARLLRAEIEKLLDEKP